MVQLTLPKNSQMRVGKTWPKPEGAKNIRKVQVYRWDPDTGDNPAWIPITSTPTAAARWCSTR